MIGRMLRRVPVAGGHRSPFAAPEFAAPATVTVTSTDFADGGRLPAACAGEGVGANRSPQLSFSAVPPHARQLILVIDDIDVPLPRPLVHTVAVLDPAVTTVSPGALIPTTPGIRCLPGSLGHRGYAGPRPIPGHGPHRYRFLLFALDQAVDRTVSTARQLRSQMAGHVVARGMLAGTFERP